jgi:diguanylate cyclase (GGDEF)-like protein/PAS domain S-box-containing protein
MCLPHGPDPLSISGALLYATALEHESEPQKLPLEEQPIQKIKSPRIHSLQLGNIGNNGNVRRRVMEAVMDVVPDLLILKTVDGQYIDGNQAFARFMGMDIADIIGRYDYELLDTLNTEKIRQWDQQVSDHQHACQYELALKSPATQKEITFDFLKIPVILPDLDEAATTAQTTNPQKRLAVVTVGRDISENKRVQARLQDQERLFHDMFETNMAVKLVIDPSTGQIVDANSAAANFYGIDKERIRQFKISFFNMSPPEEVQRQMAAAHKGERRYFEFKHRNMSGELRDVEVYSGPVHFRGRTYLYSIIHDVSSRKKAEAIIKHQANYDSLTDLPNRNLFMDRLQQTVALAQQDGRMVCVLFVDLDRFKPINDTMGHEVGDAVLEEVAERLRDSCRNSDTVARFGGDEFVIMLPHVKNIRAAQKVSEKILNALSRPFIIKNDEIFISASIGISICPNDTTHWEDMVKHADVAMYQAKEAGRDQYRFFTEEMDREARSRLRIESELRNALERRELRLVYQPILCTRQKKITHAEALLRWDHHIMGSISPMTFIPIAEETGLIANIGEWVLQEAVQTAALSQKYGVSVAANVSSRQCRDGRHAQIVQNLLSHTALTPSQLHLEITENIMLDDVPGAIDGLQDLRKLGVKVSVDDFGTGYSSLSYLRRFPVDTVKIDKSFVTDMTTSSGSMALVEAIIKMAHALKLKVIAEGVETYQQYLMLVGLQCDYIQGYYISRPLEKDAFLDMIAQPEILKTLEVV